MAAADGGKHAALIANISEKDAVLSTNLSPAMKGFLLDQEHFLTETDQNPASFVLKQNQVILLKNF